MLKLGSQNISALYLGGREIKRAYLGEPLVFGPAPVQTYTITAAIDPSGTGTVTGAGQYQEGATVTLVATAGDGYEFSGWQEGGQTVSTGATYTFTATADRTLTAAFEVKAPPRLPAEYQEVEYVDFDGSTRINNAINYEFTYFGFELEMELLPTSVNGQIAGQYAYYTYKPGSTTYYRRSYYSLGISGENIVITAYYSNKTSSASTDYRGTTLPKQSGKMKIAWDLQSKTFSVNDSSGTYAPKFANKTTTAVMDPQIGCRSNNTSSKVSYDQYTPFRFYEMKTFYINGSSSDVPTKNDLNNHLVPCYRKSDGTVGLYDIQKNVFRVPVGTLIAGPAV